MTLLNVWFFRCFRFFIFCNINIDFHFFICVYGRDNFVIICWFYLLVFAFFNELRIEWISVLFMIQFAWAIDISSLQNIFHNDNMTNYKDRIMGIVPPFVVRPCASILPNFNGKEWNVCSSGDLSHKQKYTIIEQYSDKIAFVRILKTEKKRKK